MVVLPGIEPGTRGASNRCSTNWATRPFWRSRRDSNPHSPPWQGGVIPFDHWTFWLRGKDSNLRPSGYEPDELTKLLHLAIYCQFIIHKISWLLSIKNINKILTIIRIKIFIAMIKIIEKKQIFEKIVYLNI